jgi:regulator of sirC expression with transglutaminase-like and TPR domain
LETKGNNDELNALISLLDEPNTAMLDQIKDKLMFYGMEAVPHLENAWDNAFDSILQERIESIIHIIQQKNLKQEFVDWKENNPYDLLTGFFLISKFQYPDLNQKEIREKVEIIKRDVWLELNSNLTALEKVKVLNHVIFDVHGFNGNKANIDAPRNLFVNNLLESKKGNHLSIGMLYTIIAQKLGIPIFGVNLPQHFILAYVDEVHDEKLSMANENEVLFYINPFNKGAVFTKREIEVFIKHLKLKRDHQYFVPSDNKTIIHRVILNLIKSFSKLGYSGKVDELKSILKVFE